MNSANVYITIIIILAVICDTAHGIQCHDCSSQTSDHCADLPSDNSTLVTCPENNFCRKTYQYLSDPETTIISRSCGWLKMENHPGDYCMLSNTNFKKETSCQCFTDACNTGPGLITPHVLLLPIIFIAISSGY